MQGRHDSAYKPFTGTHITNCIDLCRSINYSCLLVKSQSLFKIYEICACVYSKFPTGGIIWLLKVSVFYFWSCFYFSPELQALLMNQLTVKVNLSGRVHWIIHTTVTCFICCNSIFNHPGLEDVGSVHWFLLLQHSETCYQSPAEVRVIRKHLTRWIELIQFVFFSLIERFSVLTVALRLCCIIWARSKEWPSGSRSFNLSVWILPPSRVIILAIHL